MPTVHGALGQSSPNPGVLTTIYTGPSRKHATVRMVVCNRGSIDSFRIAVSPGGVPIESRHYLVYDMLIAANDSLSSSAFTVREGDLVRVFSTNGNLSFTLTGIEEDG